MLYMSFDQESDSEQTKVQVTIFLQQLVSQFGTKNVTSLIVIAFKAKGLNFTWCPDFNDQQHTCKLWVKCILISIDLVINCLYLKRISSVKETNKQLEIVAHSCRVVTYTYTSRCRSRGILCAERLMLCRRHLRAGMLFTSNTGLVV